MTRSLVLLGVLSACGDQIAGVDASPPVDANKNLVTVEVRSANVSETSRVFFQRQDSTLVLTTTTDRSGRVEAYIPPHTMVTVELVGPSGERSLMTVLEVNPGDDLVFDDGTKPSSVATITVSAPIPEDTYDFHARAPCQIVSGSFVLGDPVRLPLTLLGCENTGSLIVESGAPNTTYLYRKNILLADHASVQLTGDYQPFHELTLRATHIPPKTRWITFQHFLLDGSHEMRSPDKEWPLKAGYDGISASVETTTLAATWPDARAITKVIADAVAPSVAGVYEWGPREGTTATVDFGDDSVHEYLTRPTHSAESNRVGWLEADQGRLADAVLIELGRPQIRWRLFAPRDAQTWVTVPVIPGLDLPFSVGSATNIAIDGGYERLRKMPKLLGQWSPNDTELEWPMDAPTGRVVFRFLGTGGD